jgi:hypothetical protein
MNFVTIVLFLGLLGFAVNILLSFSKERRMSGCAAFCLFCASVTALDMQIRQEKVVADLSPGEYQVHHSWRGGEKDDYAIFSLVQNLDGYPDGAEAPIKVISEKQLSTGCIRIDEKRQIWGIACPDDAEFAEVQ